MTTTSGDPKTYLDCMQSAKLRLRLAESIVDGKVKVGEEAAEMEFACLQIRKCLELIAFASVAAHKDTYAAAHAEFANHWRPLKLLKKLRDLHPDFYPQPVVVQREADGIVHLSRIMNEYLTEADFVFLYEKLSDALHEWSPYRTDPRVIELTKPIGTWLDQMKRLLEWHIVQLVGTSDFWLIQFDGPDGLAHAYPAGPIPKGAAPPPPLPPSPTQD